MGKKRRGPEAVIGKLREAKVLMAKGARTAEELLVGAAQASEADAVQAVVMLVAGKDALDAAPELCAVDEGVRYFAGPSTASGRLMDGATDLAQARWGAVHPARTRTAVASRWIL